MSRKRKRLEDDDPFSRSSPPRDEEGHVQDLEVLIKFRDMDHDAEESLPEYTMTLSRVKDAVFRLFTVQTLKGAKDWTLSDTYPFPSVLNWSDDCPEDFTDLIDFYFSFFRGRSRKTFVRNMIHRLCLETEIGMEDKN